MKKQRLREMADLRSGYSFRNRIKALPSSDFAVIQMKDLRTSGGFHRDELLQIEPPANYESHLVLAGDVLIAARGLNNRAMAVMTIPGKTVPASNLFLITPHKTLAPEYLACFLNLPETQAQLRSVQAGSSIPFLPIAALSELRIPVPSIEDQLRIAEVYKLRLREEELLEKIKNLRRMLIDASLRQVLTRQTDLPSASSRILNNDCHHSGRN